MASDTETPQTDHAPLGGTRAQAMQRLQIGLSGLGAMILLVGLANVIMDRAKETEAGSVPEAASTVAAGSSAGPVSDPLADAGVAPEVPLEPSPQPQATLPGAAGDARVPPPGE